MNLQSDASNVGVGQIPQHDHNQLGCTNFPVKVGGHGLTMSSITASTNPEQIFRPPRTQNMGVTRVSGDPLSFE